VATEPLIKYEVDESFDGRLVHIVLNRPERLNAMNDALTKELVEAFERFDTDERAWVAIMRGEGRAFSSGGDVKDRHTKARAELIRDGGPSGRGADLSSIFHRCVHFKPIIAACHGYVIGGAAFLAFQCDVIVAEDDTVFQVNEVARGLAPTAIWAVMTVRGARTFCDDVALTGRRFSGREAADAGLVNRLVPPGQHVAAAREMAATLLANPPLGARALVRNFRYTLERFQREMSALSDPYRLWLTKDFEESARAFVERRAPVFRGE
jgi:enoyl-CoA hydratase/carnithine racemase